MIALPPIRQASAQAPCQQRLRSPCAPVGAAAPASTAVVSRRPRGQAGRPPGGQAGRQAGRQDRSCTGNMDNRCGFQCAGTAARRIDVEPNKRSGLGNFAGPDRTAAACCTCNAPRQPIQTKLAERHCLLHVQQHLCRGLDAPCMRGLDPPAWRSAAPARTCTTVVVPPVHRSCSSISPARRKARRALARSPCKSPTATRRGTAGSTSGGGGGCAASGGRGAAGPRACSTSVKACTNECHICEGARTGLSRKYARNIACKVATVAAAVAAQAAAAVYSSLDALL